LNARVAASADDAEESASGSVNLTSSDLELVFDSSIQKVGIRLAGLAIPPGASITAASIQFTAKEVQSEVTSLTIQAQAIDNAPGFTSAASSISSRIRTAASVAWSPVAWSIVGQAGANQKTPDLSSVIQQVVSRPGWASGNAMVFIITGTGHRTPYSFDGSATLAPLLHVEFTCAGGAPNQAPNGVIDTPSAATAITAGQSVSFTGTGSDPDSNTPLSFAWSFGGGAASTTVEDPGSVVFATAGTYTVTFTVRDSLGLADPTPDSRVITVNATATGNLIGNPSLETDTHGWAVYTAGASSVRVPGGVDGSWCLETTGPASTALFGVNDSPNWVPTTGPAGTRYRITAWVRSAANHGGARIKVREYAGATLLTNIRSASVPLSPTWQLLSIDIVTAAAGSNLDVQVLDSEPLVSGEVFQTDAISIQTAP